MNKQGARFGPVAIANQHQHFSRLLTVNECMGFMPVSCHLLLSGSSSDIQRTSCYTMAFSIMKSSLLAPATIHPPSILHSSIIHPSFINPSIIHPPSIQYPSIINLPFIHP
jgi:hypothetical protein